MLILLGMLIAFVAFTISASVGLGGSLLLVPAMVIVFGAKPGIAISAILLSLNNIGKVYVYRKTIPFKAALPIVALTMIGAATGATAMLVVDEIWVDFAVLLVILVTFFVELTKYKSKSKKTVNSLLMAYFSGCTSGFSGTSGPLKGLAIRTLNLERMYFAGAASIVSLFGDVVKASIYTKSALLTNEMWMIVAACVVVIPFAVNAGKKINSKVGEQIFANLFWLVMFGYGVRLFLIK